MRIALGRLIYVSCLGRIFINRDIFLPIFIPYLLNDLSHRELYEGKHDARVRKVVSNLSVLSRVGEVKWKSVLLGVG